MLADVDHIVRNVTKAGDKVRWAEGMCVQRQVNNSTMHNAAALKQSMLCNHITVCLQDILGSSSRP
jgi:hypothetical protein